MSEPAKTEALALIACKVAMRSSMSSSAKAVFAVLLDHFNWKTGRCDPGMARIAKLAGRSVEGVRKAVRTLVAENLLVVTTHGGGSDRNHYQFAWDEIRRRDAEHQAVLGYVPNGTDPPSQTGQGGPSRLGRQTRRTKPDEETLGVELRLPPSTSLRGKSTQPRHSLAETQVPMLMGIRGGKAASKKDAAEAAEGRRLATAITKLSDTGERERAWLAAMAEADRRRAGTTG